jgi:hypothetical protein
MTLHRASNGPEVRKHPESGLRSQRVTGPDAEIMHRHILPLPPMCPVSGNPREGSTLILSYLSSGWCLEKYSLSRLLRRFNGGWKGTPRYPAERNMEGAAKLIAKMAADAVGVPVRAHVRLKLDGGPRDRITLRVAAAPSRRTRWRLFPPASRTDVYREVVRVRGRRLVVQRENMLPRVCL